MAEKKQAAEVHSHGGGAHSHTHPHSHSHTHTNTKAVLNRLSRAIGHLESIKRMVEDGRDCSEVLIQLSIAADGRVTDARVLKPSGVKAMDESIERMLAGLDRVPTPPNGKVTFQLVMRTE